MDEEEEEEEEGEEIGGGATREDTAELHFCAPGSSDPPEKTKLNYTSAPQEASIHSRKYG